MFNHYRPSPKQQLISYFFIGSTRVITLVMTSDATKADFALANLGLRVAELRVGRGLTQERFAEHIGCSVTYVRRIEAGRANLTVRSLVALAELLDVDLPSLFAAPAHRGKRMPGRPKARL